MKILIISKNQKFKNLFFQSDFIEPSKIIGTQKYLFYDKIFLLNNDFKDAEFLWNKLKNLKIDFFGNPPIFQNLKSKKSLKKILIQNQLKTPVFEESQNLKESFFNFPQPSLIFDEKYQKIKKIKNFQDLEKIPYHKKYILEEYIPGKTYWFFAWIKNEEFFILDTLQIKGKDEMILDQEDKKEIKEKIKEFFQKTDLNFGLLKILKNPKRGWYILDLKTQPEILLNQKIKKIFDLNQINFNEIFN